MKRILYMAILALVLIACGQSKVEKADALIKQSLRKTLYKPETYNPIETKVDSAFAPYDDPTLFEELKELVNIGAELESLESEAKQARSSMSIWSGPYQTEFGRNQYQEAKEEFEEANAKIEKLKTKLSNQVEKVITILHSETKFIGYKAEHNFRADNNAGNTLIGNNIFFIDKDFENVTYSMEVDEYNQIQKAIEQIEEQLEEAE